MTATGWSNIKSLTGTNWYDEAGEVLGVYMIEASKSKTIYVGQGHIASRLSAHKNDQRILKYRNDGLVASYKIIPDKKERLKIEETLRITLTPKVGEN